MADIPTLPNTLTHCPICGDELPNDCGIDVGGSGPVTCCCGTRFYNGTFADESVAFLKHLENVEHDWKKLAVRRTLESM